MKKKVWTLVIFTKGSQTLNTAQCNLSKGKKAKKKEEKSVACSHNFIRQLDNRMVLFYVFMGKTSMYTIRVSAHVVVSALKSWLSVNVFIKMNFFGSKHLQPIVYEKE